MTLLTSNLARGRRCVLLAGLVAALAPMVAEAHDPAVYPARGQSPARQDNDSYQCYRWAMGQTGYDPATGAGGGPPPHSSALKGAAGGAAVGAIGGAIGGNAGLGAAIGAGTGAIIGGARRRKQEEQQAAARDAYNRAFGACMSGKGYSVRY